jgi:exonuclease VII small subunit
MIDDEGNIGIITEEREQENEKRRMNKIVDKLEKRIATLEKVLQSHAKCIGELRGTDLRIHDLKDNNE